MGTDFTFEDIHHEGKLELSDYHFKTLSKDVIDGKEALLVEAFPVDAETGKELGYG